MNSMEKIAEIFDLKLNEPFRIYNKSFKILYEGDYYFDEKGIHGPDGEVDAMYDFINVLIGNYEIKK